MDVLKVDGLSKRYGKIQALKNVSFSVPAGTVFGILGPNGSGKTTLLGIIMDVLKANEGSFLWNGKPGNHLQRKRIGTLLETPNFYQYMSAEDNLKIAAEIKGHGKEDIPKALQTVNLYQRKNSKFNSYSLGMKQRLAIASALLGNPDILVFDEPTNGLDPAGIAEIRDLIQELNRQGKTIIMASHILDEVEKVCTHVAIIQKGDLKMTGSVNEVLSNSSNKNKIIEAAAADLPALQSALQQMPGIVNVSLSENRLLVTCEEYISPEQINKFCFERSIVLSRLSMKIKSLETRFLEITGTQSDR